jgi:glycosyltransferase involved in cell wall biosynthesis
MGKLKVSILMPCYNADKYIGETLEAAFRQTWPAIEVIVVNDGLVDRSAAVVRSLARPNLRLVEQENRSQTARSTCVWRVPPRISYNTWTPTT